MQPTVFVANDDVVGPLRGGLDKKTQSGGVLGKIEFELRGVGVGGLEGREQWGACRSNRSVLVAGTVQQSHFAWGRSQSRILGAARRCGGFVEAGAQGDDVAAASLSVDVDHGIGEMAVDLTEIFFLPTGERAFVAAGGESQQQSKIDDGAPSNADRGDPGNLWLAGKPKGGGRSQGKKKARPGRPRIQRPRAGRENSYCWRCERST